ncbi:TRAP transporter small permease [Nitrincola tibetensis]|uniref:TRAP transporter small permease protein n=1 Tax=Nitrincola tibetensis TaxID=2219697 RepID=A0A364NPT4_9GAMM|nr:TRAP transporter small permease subunit [Nitrincola tibetensis]RAU18907.1 TRAP transporter small permease [Nitrincola tibetensis]
MSFVAWLKAHYDEKGPIRWLAFLLELIAAVMLMVLMLITCVDVVGRYVFNKPLPGSIELTEIGMAILIFAAMPVVTWRGGHIVVDLLDRYLSTFVVKCLSLLSAIVISGSFYYLGNRIYQLGERSIRRGEVTEFLGISSGYIVQYIAIMSWATALGMITYGVYRIFFQDKSN